MTSIKTIINKHRTQLEVFGFMSRAQAAQQSERVRKMRPSLRKVSIALQEDPNLLRRNVQASPLALLFEYTLPKIEHVLAEVGEKRAGEIITALVEHGMKMISKHGVEGARKHLEELFGELTEYEGELREDRGVESIIEAYREIGFEGKGENYLRLKLGEKIKTLEIRDNGVIHLSMQQSTNDADLAYFRRVKNLRMLSLCETQVGDAGLKHLSGVIGLRKLYLDQTQVGDEGLKHLSGSTDLRELYLWKTKVSDEGLRHLSGINDLQVLILGSTQISDRGLEHLSGLTSLRSLVLSPTRVSDEGLRHLSGLKGLQKLNLFDTRVSDEGLRHLSGLTGLQELDLLGAHVSDKGLKHLSGLTGLRVLFLRDTDVSDKGMEELKMALPGLKIFK